ncbi:MAG: Rpn family recombination-promoting nuclease/putative transposase [Alphaproteobacteria bacterium]|nr:Rpn family recombination-promoting nuclease/putative transposase [Alphaproteobacteria bacterium]
MSETTLLDIQSDYIFKRVFGIEKNKELLISLINSILKGNPQVTDIEIRNSEISKIFKNNLTIHLDIKAEINPQEFVDIEIQVRNTGEIMERAIQYLAEILTENCRKLTEEEKKAGQKQTYKYPKVIGIWIMGENVTDRADAVNEACLAFPPTERDEYQIITDKLHIFFVELPKFHPKHVDRKNMLDVWMAFLKNPLNDDIQDVPEVRKALDTLKEISADKNEREIYNLRQQTEFGYISEKNVAVEKAHKAGKAEGRAEGLAKGEKIGIEKGTNEKAIEVAKKMLSDGMSVELVAKYSDLSAEEIDKLKHHC